MSERVETIAVKPDEAGLRLDRWFRLHFQYLCAFDRPGDYDYFAITAGPVPLARRFAHRRHSPGRPMRRRPCKR